MKPVTAFQQKVYDAVSLVPRGRVTTYRALGDFIGCHSAQAVGQALKGNPFAPRVPCHRVIASSLCPGGFQGQRGGKAVRDKLALLAEEGVRFHEGRLADLSRLFVF